MIGLDELEDVNRVGREFVVGAVFAVCTVVMLGVWVLLNRGADSPSPSIAQRVFLGLAAAIIVAGYLSGLASVVYRPARRLGLGILIGLTVTLPVALGLAVTMMWQGN